MKLQNLMFLFILAIFMGTGFSVDATTQERSIPWFTNYEKAVQLSKISSKPIFLFFTSSDWCGWCNKLEKEIFESPDFIDVISEELIFVKLDYPQLIPQNPQISDQNEQLKKKFSIRSFPTVIILDPDQHPIGTTGYRPGNGKQYAQHVMRIVSDYTAYQQQVAQLDTEKLSGRELKKLYQKAQEFGFEKDCSALMTKGAHSSEAQFFLIERYRHLVQSENPEEETIAFKQRLLASDPDNAHLTHYQVAVIDFETAYSEMEKKNFSPDQAIAPLLSYIAQFGDNDKENLWRLHMIISQIYLDKHRLNQALKHAQNSYDAAPTCVRHDIAKAITSIQQQMQHHQ